jgi:heme/copper-type cytochrome/quinol oxidase subunit 2
VELAWTVIPVLILVVLFLATARVVRFRIQDESRLKTTYERLRRTLPRGAPPSGKTESDLVPFADGGKKEHGSSAVPTTTGRPAEELREGSGMKVEGTAAQVLGGDA